MRVRLNQERLGPAKAYGASNTMALALVTLYTGTPDTIITDHARERQRFTAFMVECTNTLPSSDNPAQQTLRELCPMAKRIKLYVSEWGMTEPSHYVILHRTPDNLFKLGCARLLRRLADFDSMIDGVTITWPSSNPTTAAGQTPTFTRLHISGASVSTDLLESEELQRELRISVETAHLYHNQDVVSVWGHPGKAVFDVSTDPITLVRVRPHAPNVSKFNVILWGDVSNGALPQAAEMPRHIVPQIKGAEPYEPADAIETNMLKWALESRLLPYIAISHTTQRGDIFALTYDPETDDCFVTCVAANHKIVGLPRVLRIDNRGADVYVPDLALAERLKALFLTGTHTFAMQQLFSTMGYKNWERLREAFKNWDLPLTLEEEDRLEIIKGGL